MLLLQLLLRSWTLTLLLPVWNTGIHDPASTTLVIRLDELPLSLVVIPVVIVAAITALRLLILILILLLLNIVSTVLNLLNLLLLLLFFVLLLVFLVVWRAINDLISLLLHAVGLLA